ncbi:MAG TPA: HAD-IB family hydrolase [Vicinamibacteria bacterium]|nr:HAD-IB family hydrolase [Vicinamibacteria bacterium]
MAKAAAFYDLDGTLIRTNLVHAFAFYARNDQGILRSVAQTAKTVLGIPVFAAADVYSRKVFNDIFFKWYKGQSEDRLRFLAQDLFDQVIRPGIYPGALELLAKSREMGLRQVVVTGALDLSIAPLLEYMGITDYVANRLEFESGRATGRLKPPVMASATKASWIRRYAEREGLSLNDCYAYADSMSDLPMLSVVGHPTATNPDVRLRSTALRHDWPIVSLR